MSKRCQLFWALEKSINIQFSVQGLNLVTQRETLADSGTLTPHALYHPI